MRGFQYTFDKGLVGGLRRFSSNPRNKQDLVECHNAMPSDDGLRPHVDVTSLDADSIPWRVGTPITSPDLFTIVVHVIDYTTSAVVADVSVYVDGTLIGTTDASGDITVTDVAEGTHIIRITKDGYVDSLYDDLANDYVVVESDSYEFKIVNEDDYYTYLLDGGLLGMLVDKTISSGNITLDTDEHYVALTGEGDVADSLTHILKTGGGYFDAGYIVTLAGKTGLDYAISLAAGGNFEIGYVFSIDDEHDSISLVHRGVGIWENFGGRGSAA